MSWFLNNMKRKFHYEYQKHVVRETLTFILMVFGFALCDLSNLLIYSNDSAYYYCTEFQCSLDLSHDDISEKALCKFAKPSVACYHWIATLLCVSYALPAISYVLVAEPHDCFYCISVLPENRISIFQYPMADLERRTDPDGSERDTGGAFDGFIFNKVMKLETQLS